MDSYQVLINTQRGAIARDTPAHNAFNHAILAIKLPDEVKDKSLIAVMKDPKLGRILFFDPTNDVVVAADHIHHGEAAVQSARQGLSADAILSGAPVGSLVLLAGLAAGKLAAGSRWSQTSSR